MTETKTIEFEVKHKLMLVNVSRSYRGTENAYEVTRGNWRVSRDRAIAQDYVLGIIRDVNKSYRVVSIYKPKSWRSVKDQKSIRQRFDDGGQTVSQKIKDMYLCKLVPPKYISPRQQNPVRYASRDD